MTLRQKYQYVRPEKNTKYARLNLKKKNYEIRAEFGICWGVLKKFLNRAACTLHMPMIITLILMLLHNVIVTGRNVTKRSCTQRKSSKTLSFQNINVT